MGKPPSMPYTCTRFGYFETVISAYNDKKSIIIHHGVLGYKAYRKKRTNHYKFTGKMQCSNYTWVWLFYALIRYHGLTAELRLLGLFIQIKMKFKLIIYN
jgi:hypothetical protein